MKTTFRKIAVSSALCSSLVVTGCGGGKSEERDDPTPAQTAKQITPEECE